MNETQASWIWTRTAIPVLNAMSLLDLHKHAVWLCLLMFPPFRQTLRGVRVAGHTEVLCNGTRIEAWAFNPNNVLSWEDSAGHTAWLLFMALPGGPLILGNVLTPEQGTASSEHPTPPLALADSIWSAQELPAGQIQWCTICQASQGQGTRH